MADLVDHVLAPHACLRDRIEISGGDCRLQPKQKLSLSLALNELITNSIKYGAMAGDGAVRIDWAAAGRPQDGLLRFTWTETGVADAQEPEHQGFGTTVLMDFVPASFAAEARMDFGGDHLVYEITAPLAVARPADVSETMA